MQNKCTPQKYGKKCQEKCQGLVTVCLFCCFINFWRFVFIAFVFRPFLAFSKVATVNLFFKCALPEWTWLGQHISWGLWFWIAVFWGSPPGWNSGGFNTLRRASVCTPSSTALTTISSATNGSRNKNGSEAVCGAARSLMRTWAKVRSWLIWAFYGFNCDQCRLETLESHQQNFKPRTPWSPKYPCGAIFRYLSTFFMFWTNPSPSSP